MKKNLLFFTFFLLIGCTSNTSTSTKVSCPDVFFAAEHSKYIDSNTQPISIDNLSYKADINNYAFNSDCLILIFFSIAISTASWSVKTLPPDWEKAIVEEKRVKRIYLFIIFIFF